jgi:capsular polysaccharide biosynthesis protein
MRTTTRWAAPKKSTREDALEGAAYLRGEWLFCGIASAQFGHIITRGLGMLWAAQALPKDVNLLFVSMLYNQDDHPFLTEFLENAGIEKTYRILSEPAQIERLFTAPDLFSEAHKCGSLRDLCGLMGSDASAAIPDVVVGT